MSPAKTGTAGRPETPPGSAALEKLLELLQTKWQTKAEKQASPTIAPADVEKDRAIRMSNIQTQLNALYDARKVNVGAGKDTSAIDVAIDTLTVKLIGSIE